jgi:hypothetical protein
MFFSKNTDGSFREIPLPCPYHLYAQKMAHQPYGNRNNFNHKIVYMKNLLLPAAKTTLLMLATWLLFSLPGFSQENMKIEDFKKRGLDIQHHQDQNGNVRDDLFRKSFTDFMQVKNGIGAKLTHSSSWTLEGPAPSIVNAAIYQNGQLPGPNAGAIFDIAIDPADTTDQIVYVVSEEGGIWKTTNQGITWCPLTDTLPTLSFGAIAMDPVNSQILYAGTGNCYVWWESFNKNGKNYRAVGIYVSHNGGKSWTLTQGSSVLNGMNVNKIICPAPGILLVATSAGLFRSTNSGNSYQPITLGGSNSSFITDLDMQEGNPNNIWASLNGNGIYYSTNQGQSFGNNLWTSSNGGPTSGYSFISMAASADGQTLYANAQQNVQTTDCFLNLPTSCVTVPLIGIWKSTNGGSSWTNITQNAANAAPAVPCWRRVGCCQAGYDQTLGVDPTNANRVYMGFQDMWLTTDGGTTWRDVSYTDTTYQYEQMHVDHHALRFSPATHRVAGQPSGIWVGNDGGVWNSTNGGTVWYNQNQGTTKDSSLATQLFEHIDIGRGSANNGWTYGGTQDNGTSAGNPTVTSPGWTQTWNEWLGGDGSFTATDWQNPQVAYGSWGVPYYTNNGGVSNHNPSITCASGNPGSYSVIRVGPQNRTVYLAGNCNNTPTLFISNNLGQNYSSAYSFSSGISSIAVSAADSNLLYVGCNNGTIYKMSYTNGTIGLLSSSTIPNTPNTSPQLAVNPVNPQIVVAVYSGYSGVNYPSKHVFLTTNGGVSWTDISGSIRDASVPDMAIYAAAFDPNTQPNSILISSDFGVMRSFDYGLTWHVLGGNLPHTHALDIALDPLVKPSLVKVGTYGRSVWKHTLDVGTYIFGMLSEKFTPIPNITIQNNSADTLYVYDEFNNNSNSYLIGKIYPNQYNACGPLYFSKVIAIKDRAGNIVLVNPLASGSANQIITISQAAVNEAQTIRLKNYPGLRSYPTSRLVNNFTAINNSSIPINIHWIDETGIPYMLATVAPSATAPLLQVYFGGTFTATDADGKLIGIYVATDAPNQSFTITNDMVNFWR